MNCPRCQQLVESGAAFCGNCGQQLVQTLPLQPTSSVPIDPATPTPEIAYQPQPQPPTYQPIQAPVNVAMPQQLPPPAIPAYAVPNRNQQASHAEVVIALTLAILGSAAALLIPLLGIALGVAGIVLLSLSWHQSKKKIRTISGGFLVLCIVVSLGSWAHVIQVDRKKNVAASNGSSSASAVSNVTTPCYKVDFGLKLNVENTQGSCNINAYNGSSFSNSTDAFKVYAATIPVSASSFNDVAKQAIEKDIKSSLPGFTITKETAGSFSGSPAYYITATSDTDQIVFEEAAVLHPTQNGDNFFALVHALSNATTIDLTGLESGWSW